MKQMASYPQQPFSSGLSDGNALHAGSQGAAQLVFTLLRCGAGPRRDRLCCLLDTCSQTPWARSEQERIRSGPGPAGHPSAKTLCGIQLHVSRVRKGDARDYLHLWHQARRSCFVLILCAGPVPLADPWGRTPVSMACCCTSSMRDRRAL